MKRIKIILKGSNFFDQVVRKARLRNIEIYVCNRKKGVITCESNDDFIEWLTAHGVVASEIPDPEKMSWCVYPAEFRITTETFRSSRSLHNLERELELPYDSLLAGYALSPEQKEYIENHGYELEIVLP